MAEKTLGKPRYGPSIILEQDCLKKEPDFIPARAWLHQNGMEEVYGNWHEAARYFQGTMRENSALFKKDFPDVRWVIAGVWADTDDGRKDKCIDCFVFHSPEEWPRNIESQTYVFRNGVFQPEARGTCEDTYMILGEEGRYRRECRDLKQYMASSTNMDLDRTKSFPIGWRITLKGFP